jgi:hypothetical protein
MYFFLFHVITSISDFALGVEASMGSQTGGNWTVIYSPFEGIGGQKVLVRCLSMAYAS